MSSPVTIALAGNPNSGKTSLFNQLTGARAHVGNYPGVTVEKREGRFHHKGREIHVVDLPGTYSLTAYSMEELVARDFIIHERPQLVVDVVDATNLERNLYLAVQFMEIGVPVVIALNMTDVAERRGVEIDVARLSELLGAAVVPTVARSGRGVDDLMDQVLAVADDATEWKPTQLRYGPDLDVKIKEIAELLDKTGRFDTQTYPPRWVALKLLEGDDKVLEIVTDTDKDVSQKIQALTSEVTRHLAVTVDEEPEAVISDHRYGYITSVTKQTVRQSRDLRRTLTDAIDLIALNRLVGPLILLLVLYLVYQFTFWVSGAPVGWFEASFAWLSGLVRESMPEGPLRSLLASGIIDGVGGVLGFVPLIAFMFFAIAVLEDSGYMARIAFMMDRVLRTFGLHGNSVLSLMVGGGLAGGCAVPGVMAARTLRDPKERLATILVTPFMNCGAKLPVFAVLIAAFFSKYEANMMFLLTLIAWGLALTAARILRWTVLRGRHTPFVMELPPYRMPTLKGLIIHAWERVWQYIKKAGTVILAVSILIWALMAFPGLPEDMERVFDHQRQSFKKELLASKAGEIIKDTESILAFTRYLADIPDKIRLETEQVEPGSKISGYDYLAKTVAALRTEAPVAADLSGYVPAAKAYLEYIDKTRTLYEGQNQARLRHSIAGRLGQWLEWFSRPLGFDWRTNIALVGGVAAKEVVISTLGTAYSLGETNQEGRSLAKRLASEPGWNPLTAFTLMLFVMMYSPCSVTVVTIGREAGWRWALFSMVYTTAAAYIVCLAVAVLGRIFGWGV
jgi:ferrous iron transport protein B